MSRYKLPFGRNTLGNLIAFILVIIVLLIFDKKSALNIIYIIGGICFLLNIIAAFMNDTGYRSINRDIKRPIKVNYKYSKFISSKDDTNICPKCGCTLIKRKGRYGLFFGCSNFPSCKYTKSLKKEIN